MNQNQKRLSALGVVACSASANLGALIAQAEAAGIKIEIVHEKYEPLQPAIEQAITAAKELDIYKYREPRTEREWWRGGRPR